MLCSCGCPVKAIGISRDHDRVSTAALITPLLGGKRVKFPVQRTRAREMVGYMRRLMESGQFTPVIDRTYACDRLVDAYRDVETGRKVGDVIINMQPSS